MIIICGKTGSGKSTVAGILEKDYGLKRIVTYTTRPMREGEKDGKDYNFLDQKTFDRLKERGFFAETADYEASFGHCSYGSSKESYDNPNGVIILNPYGLKEVIRTRGREGLHIFYLSIPESLIRRRLFFRGDSLKEIERRLQTDRVDFDGIMDFCDFQFDQTEETKAEDIAAMIAGLCGITKIGKKKYGPFCKDLATGEYYCSAEEENGVMKGIRLDPDTFESMSDKKEVIKNPDKISTDSLLMDIISGNFVMKGYTDGCFTTIRTEDGLMRGVFSFEGKNYVLTLEES